jgi:hypothetical protein
MFSCLAGGEADTSPVSAAKIKNNWSNISSPTFALVSCAWGQLSFALILLITEAYHSGRNKKLLAIFSCQKIIQI